MAHADILSHFRRSKMETRVWQSTQQSALSIQPRIRPDANKSGQKTRELIL
jgi:hypothetical protein